jgi:hypothetical protein
MKMITIYDHHKTHATQTRSLITIRKREVLSCMILASVENIYRFDSSAITGAVLR